jgi:arginine repressor
MTTMDSHNDAAPKGKKAKQAKISRVLREFKAGTLKSSSGEKITNYKQAVAVALSQAGMSMPKKDASEEYMRAFIKQVLQEEEAMEEEENEEENEMEDSLGKP